MKRILFALLLSPLGMLAQDCKLISETDPYTKEVKLSTGFMDLEGARLTIDATKQEVDFLFAIVGADKCYTDASTAAIFFEGTKTKLTQRNGGSMNCEGLFHFIFRNGTTPPSVFQKLSTQKVTKIVFTGNNKAETTVTLDPEQQQILMELAACMMKEAPKLIQ
jgi:hypothetical protein